METEKGIELIRTIILYPGRRPEVRELINSVHVFETAVQGPVEVLRPFDDDVILMLNEEGAKMQLQPNRTVMVNTMPVTIAGPIVIAGVKGKKIVSLTDNQVATYRAMFRSLSGRLKGTNR